MRVLFLATFFPRPGNQLLGPWALLQAKALARAGVDLRVVSLNPWIPSFAARSPGCRAYALCPTTHNWDGLTVEYPHWLFYPFNPLKRWAYADPRRQLNLGWASIRKYLTRYVRDFKPDVIYAHHACVNGYLAARLQRLFGIPFVTTDHDFTEIADCAAMPGRRAMFEQVYRGASTAVTVAKRMEDDIHRLFPGAHAQTVYNGIDPLDPSLWEVPRPPEIADKLVILSVGNFAVRKGFPLLVRAFARVASRFPNAVLRIIGAGNDQPAVDQAVREANLGDRVQLLGKQPHDRVLQEMVWADVFALIGWDEPFATVFIEAMGARKPLLWAEDGGINDVVQTGVHGISIPPRSEDAVVEGLTKLLQSDLAAMGRAASDLVQARLTWDANARTMVRLFEEAARRAS